MEPLASFVELYLYPERFFRERMATVGAWLTTERVMVLIGLIGVESWVDQQDNVHRLLAATQSSQSAWRELVALLIWVPLIGTLSYHLGKVWFRIRLALCGATPDYDRLTIAFAVCEAGWCLPSVAIGLPALLLGVGSDQLLWIAMSTAGWAFYIDYRAARVAFGASRSGALFLFVIVPAVALVSAISLAFYDPSR